jgi:hypothetical protein
VGKLLTSWRRKVSLALHVAHEDDALRRMCVKGGGSSRAVTRLHTMIGLTGYRTRDLLRISRALYWLTEKA